MKLLPVLALAAVTAVAGTATAAPHSKRIRGSVQSVGQHSLALDTRSGGHARVMLNGSTHYAWVVRSSLSKLGKGDYIGTATTQSNGRPVALELVIFPQSMRGMGEGHYPWDKLPDTMQGGHGMVSSRMTNGTVSEQSNGVMKHTAMTNGSVSASHKRSDGQEITVAYNGKQKKIRVPSSAPIVAFEPAHKSAVTKGAKVFIIAQRSGDHWVAGFVAVGKNGLRPPM